MRPSGISSSGSRRKYMVAIGMWIVTYIHTYIALGGFGRTNNSLVIFFFHVFPLILLIWDIRRVEHGNHVQVSSLKGGVYY